MFRWRERVARALPRIRDEAWPLLQAGLDMYNARMSAIMVGIVPLFSEKLASVVTVLLILQGMQT